MCRRVLAVLTMETSNEAGTVFETVHSSFATVHTFRPRYLLDNGLQRVTFTAEVDLPGRPSPCCSTSYVLPMVSAKPALVKSIPERDDFAYASARIAQVASVCGEQHIVDHWISSASVAIESHKKTQLWLLAELRKLGPFPANADIFRPK